jgi:hypothetical protein
MVLHDVTFNVTAMIWLWSFIFFSRNYTRSIVLKLSQDPRQQKEFQLTHNYKYGVEIWATCSQLDLEVMCKRSKKREDHLIFINFRVKKFIIKNTQKKKNFDVWML